MTESLRLTAGLTTKDQRPAMDNLDRMYRHLVRTVRARFPQYLTQPFDVAELHQTVLPYRHYRRELGLETNEDYEITLTDLYSHRVAEALGLRTLTDVQGIFQTQTDFTLGQGKVLWPLPPTPRASRRAPHIRGRVVHGPRCRAFLLLSARQNYWPHGGIDLAR